MCRLWYYCMTLKSTYKGWTFQGAHHLRALDGMGARWQSLASVREVRREAGLDSSLFSASALIWFCYRNPTNRFLVYLELACSGFASFGCFGGRNIHMQRCGELDKARKAGESWQLLFGVDQERWPLWTPMDKSQSLFCGEPQVLERYVSCRPTQQAQHVRVSFWLDVSCTALLVLSLEFTTSPKITSAYKCHCVYFRGNLHGSLLREQAFLRLCKFEEKHNNAVSWHILGCFCVCYTGQLEFVLEYFDMVLVYF